MIYFTSYETFHALVAMLAFGAVFPLLEASLTLIFKTLKNAFHFLKLSYRQTVTFQEIKIKFEADLKNKLVLFFFDFILIITFFIFFIFLSYAFYDGILRIYFLLIAFLACVFSRKIFNKFKEGFERLVCVFLTVVFFIISYLLVPIKVFARLGLKLANLFYAPLKNKLKNIASEKIFKRKCREIQNFLQNI